MFSYPENTFKYCPVCGKKSISSPRWGRVICTVCDLDFFFNIASAAAAIVWDDCGRILLTRRQHDPSRGMLDLPGGFLDENETAEDGLRRELREETGLEITSLAYLCTFPNRYDYKGVRYRTLDLYFTARVGDLSTARALDEVSEIVIRAPSEVDMGELAFESTRKVFETFMKKYI